MDQCVLVIEYLFMNRLTSQGLFFTIWNAIYDNEFEKKIVSFFFNNEHIVNSLGQKCPILRAGYVISNYRPRDTVKMYKQINSDQKAGLSGGKMVLVDVLMEGEVGRVSCSTCLAGGNICQLGR